jgi:probable rRNA maturation factor
VAEELALLTVHGILHLLGYDHLEPADQAVMWARTNDVLERLGVPLRL